MGRARRGKGGLKENLDDGGSNKKGGGSGTRGLNKGKGQEITGVTLPADGKHCNEIDRYMSQLSKTDKAFLSRLNAFNALAPCCFTVGSVKGWEFGEKKTMACAQVDGRFFALEGQCPRCACESMCCFNALANLPEKLLSLFLTLLLLHYKIS